MAGPPVSQNATPTGDTRYDITRDPGAQQVGPGQWIGSDGVTYQGDDPSMLLGNRANVLDPNLTDWRGTGGTGTGSYSSGGGGSSMFGNPYYQQYEASNKAMSAADLAETKAQLQQMLIQFGLVPGNYQDKLGSLDDTIRQLISKNTESGISQYARMMEGKEDTQRGTLQELAKSGLLRSGAKGHKMRRNQLNFDRLFSDAVNAVMGSANILQSGYAGREMSRQQQLSQFLASLFSGSRMGSSGPGGRFITQPQQQPTPQPQFNLEQAQQYWQSDPAPTYTSPTSGQQWYGGFGGLESTPFKGKAADSLY
jgi:hypothetical protein